MAFYINDASLSDQFVTEYELIDKWVSCNTVKVCGSNTYGQLGLDTTTTVFNAIFQDVPNVSNIKQVATGSNFSAILRPDGFLYTCGDNSYGQLGVDSALSQFIKFMPVYTGLNINYIACGATALFAVDTDGNLYACGKNTNNMLGISSGDSFRKMQQVPYASGVVQVACGLSHTVILKQDGTIMVAGSNAYGQLGPVLDATQFTSVPNITDIKQIACGDNHTILLTKSGTLYATGLNNNHQLGLSEDSYNNFTLIPDVDSVRSVSTHQGHTIIVLNDGTILGCGLNVSGQLGMGNLVSAYTVFVPITNITNIRASYCINNTTLLLRVDGTVLFAGRANKQVNLSTASYYTFQPLPNITDIKQLSVGQSHTMLLKY
jgi:alpha-tubulin suppressor-like RCC1 family protein